MNRPARRLSGMILFAASLARGALVAAARTATNPVRFFDPSGAGHIGEDRALALWTSAVLPALRDRQAFTTFPALPENRRIREARAALGLPAAQTLRAQWGLMEWRNDQG